MGLLGSEDVGLGSVLTAAGDDSPDIGPGGGGTILTPQQLGLDWFGAMKWIFASKTQLNPLQWQAETSRGEAEDFNAADGAWINDIATHGAGSFAGPVAGGGSVMQLIGPAQLTAGFARWFPGAGGTETIAKFTGMVESGESAVFGYLADPGQNLANANPPESAPQLYPTSARQFLRMLVTATDGGMTTDYTVTLYKNAVATAQQVTIPAGTAPGTVVVDDVHPIAFTASDKFDVRWDNSAGGVFKAVAVTLEGGSPSIADQLWSIRQRRFLMGFRLAAIGGLANAQPYMAGLANIVNGAPNLKFGLGTPNVAGTPNWHVTVNDVSIFDTGVPLQLGGVPRDFMINAYIACTDFEHLTCSLLPGQSEQIAGTMDLFNAFGNDFSARPFAGAESPVGGNFSQPGLYLDKAILVKEL